MRRIIFLVLVFALSVVAWPAATANAHIEFDTDEDTCEIVVSWNDHDAINPTWEHFQFWGAGKLSVWMEVKLSIISAGGPYVYSRQTDDFGPHAMPARLPLPGTKVYRQHIEHREWWWRAKSHWKTFHTKLLYVAEFYNRYEGSGRIPEHCLPPPPCYFVGGFGDLVQRIDVGACHNDELSVAGGALQSAENGILFYNRDNPSLEFFTWAQAWRALAAAPTVANQPAPAIGRPEAAFAFFVECRYDRGFRSFVFNNPEVGLCLNNEQFVSGGAIQSGTNGIVLYDRDRLRLEFFNWQRVWQILAASPTSTPQPVPAPHTQAATAAPTAPQCQYVLGFGDWVQQNPAAGNCHNNELSVTGGSLQSTQNGILFYDRDNRGLAFFNWAQVWQAVAPQPFTQPQLPPTTDSQTAAHCQFVLGFANWVQQHADAGACLHSEQFLASGSVQSTQHGILFYDSSSQRLGFFNWEQVWQGLASLASSQ